MTHKNFSVYLKREKKNRQNLKNERIYYFECCFYYVFLIFKYFAVSLIFFVSLSVGNVMCPLNLCV